MSDQWKRWMGFSVEQELSRHKVMWAKMGHGLRKNLGREGIDALHDGRRWAEGSWMLCFHWVGSDSTPCWLDISEVPVEGPVSINYKRAGIDCFRSQWSSLYFVDMSLVVLNSSYDFCFSLETNCRLVCASWLVKKQQYGSCLMLPISTSFIGLMFLVQSTLLVDLVYPSCWSNCTIIRIMQTRYLCIPYLYLRSWMQSKIGFRSWLEEGAGSWYLVRILLATTCY